ncbi:hypothetical protein COLO4_38132 [Corchorus olitorius]|uniref:Uncharacterized protein n=1 Tax=Corchorus olitorius TaxID=93759 RepID=A0A1R3FWT0_9ROSI|nr:hypothetical protein COLO4_38132 [Corchorus olitorius]
MAPLIDTIYNMPFVDQNDQLNQEKDGHGTIVPKELTVSIRLGDNHRDQIKAVIRRGGGAHGGGGDVAGNNGGGDGKSANGQGAAVIPVYAAGATNNNRYHHHGSSSGTINCIASTCFLFILFTSFMLFVYSM